MDQWERDLAEKAEAALRWVLRCKNCGSTRGSDLFTESPLKRLEIPRADALRQINSAERIKVLAEEVLDGDGHVRWYLQHPPAPFGPWDA